MGFSKWKFQISQLRVSRRAWSAETMILGLGSSPPHLRWWERCELGDKFHHQVTGFLRFPISVILQMGKREPEIGKGECITVEVTIVEVNLHSPKMQPALCKVGWVLTNVYTTQSIDKYQTCNSVGEKEDLICSLCWFFLMCKYFHHCWFQSSVWCHRTGYWEKIKLDHVHLLRAGSSTSKHLSLIQNIHRYRSRSRTFIALQISSGFFLSQSPLHTEVITDQFFCYHRLTLLGIRISGIIQYALFCVSRTFWNSSMLLHVLEVCSFLLLCIPLYVCATIRHSPVDGHSHCFQFDPIIKKAAISNCVWVLFGNRFSFFGGRCSKYIEMKVVRKM